MTVGGGAFLAARGVGLADAGLLEYAALRHVFFFFFRRARRLEKPFGLAEAGRPEAETTPTRKSVGV
jgi:hypothetical protein